MQVWIGRQADLQSNIVEIEGETDNNKVSILINWGATLISISPTLIDSNKIKKVKHVKP